MPQVNQNKNKLIFFSVPSKFIQVIVVPQAQHPPDMALFDFLIPRLKLPLCVHNYRLENWNKRWNKCILVGWDKC